MRCKFCGKEMWLENGYLDNPYCREAEYCCECGGVADCTWWGSSDEPEIEWEQVDSL